MRVMKYQRSHVLSGDVTFVIVANFGYIHIFVSAWNTHCKTERFKTVVSTVTRHLLVCMSNNDCIYILMFIPTVKKLFFLDILQVK